jgi:hypothetical protein
MRRISLALVLASMLAAGACSKVSYKNSGMVPTGPTHEYDGAFFIGGLVGDERIPVYQMCPNGVAQMQSKFSFGDLVLHVITFFIYAPRSYEITCGQPAGGAQ